MATGPQPLKIEGILSVMLTPFHDDGTVDYPGLARLVDWYVNQGCDALFAVCQSSEMLFLTARERIDIARFVVEKTAGRVPVIASGHVSADRDAQCDELTAMAKSGVDGLVLVANRLDPENAGEAAFLGNLDWLLARLPPDLPLGLYECPAPFRRLLTDRELLYCARSGRFVVFKDVCCDLATLKRRLALVAGGPLAVINANGSIALDAMKAGSQGYSGVFTNIHPDLYAWMYRSWRRHEALAEELSDFLVTAAVAEMMGYPVLAKIYHQRIGTFQSIKARVIDFDIRQRFWWGVDPVLDHITTGSARFRQRIDAVQAR